MESFVASQVSNLASCASWHRDVEFNRLKVRPVCGMVLVKTAAVMHRG